MKTILIYFVLFNLSAFLLTFVILGVCFLGKLLFAKQNWTEFFRDLTLVRALFLFVLGVCIFAFISFYAIHYFFTYFDLDNATVLAISIPTIQIILFMLLIKKGRQYIRKGEVKEPQDTIYK